MAVYVFAYHAKPTKGSPQYGKMAGAHVDIWVHDDARESAETRALAHLMDCAWVVISAEGEAVLHDGQISQQDKDVQACYFRAKRDGIFAFFSAYLPERPSNGGGELRAIENPPKGSDSIH